MEQIGSVRVVPGVSTIIRRINMTPEPKIIETLSARKDRRAVEAEAAWKEHQARELAVNRNMIRLREERLAREARAAAGAAEPENEHKSEPKMAPRIESTIESTIESKIKPTRVRRKVAATSEAGAAK